MKKRIPKLKFEVSNLDSDIKDLIFFLNEISIKEFQEKILNEYPILEKRLEGTKKKERVKIITRFFLHYQRENKGKVGKTLVNFQHIWDCLNETFMQTAEEVLEIDWPKNYETIFAKLSLSTINPILIEENEFYIYNKTKTKEMRDVVFPKVLMFLYNEKWNKIFPQEELKFRNLAWKLYEILIYTIFSDSRFRNKFRYKNKPNSKYEEIFIDDNFLLNHIDNFYKNRASFEDFLKKSWKFIQENENKLY